MVTTDANILEIEVDSQLNDNLRFFPAEKTVRGTFDFHRVKDSKASDRYNAWPKPIPGQRIRLDMAAGRAAIVEPLHDDQYESIRARIKKKGSQIPPALEEFSGVDPATWLYWMQRAVASGHARLIAGEFPSSLPGKPRKDFFFKQPENPQRNLIEAIDSLATATAAQTELLSELVKSLKERNK